MRVAADLRFLIFFSLRLSFARRGSKKKNEGREVEKEGEKERKSHFGLAYPHGTRRREKKKEKGDGGSDEVPERGQSSLLQLGKKKRKKYRMRHGSSIRITLSCSCGQQV